MGFDSLAQLLCSENFDVSSFRFSLIFSNRVNQRMLDFPKNALTFRFLVTLNLF